MSESQTNRNITAAAHTQLMAGGTEESLLRDKKGLLVAIGSSVDKIIGHFNGSRNHVQKAQLGDSRLSPELGHLLLAGLCPSLYSLVADGLKPFHRDIIVGRRRLSPWSLVEASVVRAGAGPLHTVLCNISRLSQLRDPRRRFNAFVFGLLNTKQVDSWVSLLHRSYDSLCLFFAPTGFLPLAVTSERGLLDELLVTLQPLSALTFHVDLLFEHHHPPLHEAPHPRGRSPLQDILSLGGWITPTPNGPCDRLPPQDSGTSWWGQLSRASRIYLPPETCSSSRWNKPTDLGGTKKPHVKPTETPPGQNSELSDTNAPPTDQTGADSSGDSAHSMGDTEWSSGGAAEPAEKNQQNSSHIAPSSGEHGGVWLGHLFGAKPSPIDTRKKSRLPSTWLPPSMSVLDLIGLSSSSERAQCVAPGPEERKGKSERWVRALCDQCGSEEGLSFRKGEELQVMNTVDEDWIRCRRGNETGLVPVCYTSLIL